MRGNKAPGAGGNSALKKRCPCQTAAPRSSRKAPIWAAADPLRCTDSIHRSADVHRYCVLSSSVAWQSGMTIAIKAGRVFGTRCLS